MTKIAPNSIELWAKEAEKQFKQSKQPLTHKQITDTAGLLLNEVYLESRMPELKEDLENGAYSNQYACAFYNRVKSHHTYVVSAALALFVGALARCSSDVIIYANYLQYMAFKCRQRELDVKFLNIWCFPDGFPTKEAMRRVWEAQKVDDGNLLDCMSAGESIAFKKYRF